MFGETRSGVTRKALGVRKVVVLVRMAGVGALLAALLVTPLRSDAPTAAVPAVPPTTLHETGLFRGSKTLEVDPAHLGFAPQYPLWTDGASKMRWISLPPGSAIDATDADAWDFPVGTRFWKEFSFDGRRVETRYMERLADGSWLFATYAWDEDGRGATLVSEKGRRYGYQFADGGWHAIPSQADCRACHESGRVPVLGFATLQLSDDRDPGALHAEPAPAPGLTLRSAVARGLIEKLDTVYLLAPPRTSTASPTQRTALGYLHGNCGHCHNPYGPLNRLGMYLRQPADARRSAALASTFRVPLLKPPPGLAPGTELRIAPGHPELSAIPQRIASRNPSLQMPPIGTARVDAEAVELITRWIEEAEITSVTSQLTGRSQK